MIRNSTNQISIKPRISTTTKLIVMVAALFMLLAMIYFSYDFGMRSGNSQYGEDAVLIEQLNNTIAKQQDDLDLSQQQIIFAERQKQIQEEAYKQMSSAYASSEQKNRYLGSRLDFYRSIISPEGGQSGPAIQAIDTISEAAQQGSDIAFDVTLVQAIKHKVNVTGNLVIELYNGEDLVKTWPESGSRSVNYQYFQQISGVFESVPALEDANIKAILSLNDGTIIEKLFVVDVEQSNTGENQSS
ncbi:hypothetical protein N9060_01115 [Arenicella sp.]|nr:hypothetical protein [Arenicella sp.]